MDSLKKAGGLPSMPDARWVQKNPEPLEVHFAQARDSSRTDPPYNRGRIVTRYVGEANWTQFHARIERTLADPA